MEEFHAFFLLPAVVIVTFGIFLSPSTSIAIASETAVDAKAALEELKDEDLSLYDSKTSSENHTGAASEGDENLNTSPKTRAFSTKAAYPFVNDYLLAQKAKPDAIQNKRYLLQQVLDKENQTMPYKTDSKKPNGIVIHATAGGPNDKINNEINYMINNWGNAFVHSFVDYQSIIELHDPAYSAWGAGRFANALMAHVELTETNTYDKFARSVNNQAYYAAAVLRTFDLKPDNAEYDGIGTIWFHSTVTLFLGGTNHSDPSGYFAKFGYSQSQFYDLVVRHYNQMSDPILSQKSLNMTTYVEQSNRADTIWSKPYNTAGANSVGAASKYNQQKATVISEATTQKGTYYQFQIAGKTIGWLDKQAFKQYDELISQKKVNYTRFIDQTNKNNALWSQPYNVVGVKKSGSAASWHDKEVTVVAEATTSSGTYYQFKSAGKIIGWLYKTAFVKPDTTTQKSISLQRFIKQTSRKDTIWSQPYRVTGTTKLANGDLYEGQQANIIAEATTSKGTYYQFKVNNKTIGWMDKRAFVAEEKTFVKTLNLNRYIDQTGRTDKIYSRPDGLLNVTTVGNAVNYHFQKVKVIAETTTSKGHFYQFSVNNQTIGWLNSQAFVDASDILTRKKIALDRFISLPSKDYAIATEPYKAIGYKKISSGKKYNGQQVRLIQQATTKNGLYYQFQIDGKTIGWMFHKAFVPEEKTTLKTLNLPKYIVPNGRTDKIYRRPLGLLNATTVADAQSYHAEKVTVIAETPTSKGSFYQFSFNNKTIGWLDKKAFVTPRVSSEKTVSLERYISLPVKDYAVATLPYQEIGYKKISSGKPYMNKKVKVIKQATTKNGLYYQFQLNGKTIGWMYHKAFVKNEPLSIKPLKLTRFIDQSGRNDLIYSHPNGQLKTQVLAKASSYHLKKVTVVAEATTSNGTFYQFSSNNKTIGWVLKKAFVAPQVTTEKVVSFNRTVAINGRDYAVATLPYKEYGYQKLSSGLKYQAKTVRIIKEATTKNGRYYQFQLNGKTIGWMYYKAFK